MLTELIFRGDYPYDGHTVELLLRRLKNNLEEPPKHVLVDRSYKSSDKPHLYQVHIAGRKQGRGKAHSEQHRRNSIEPIIGHMKSEGLLDRCHLQGQLGDKIHAVLCGVGMNLRKVLKKMAELLLGRKKVNPLELMASSTGHPSRKTAPLDRPSECHQTVAI